MNNFWQRVITGLVFISVIIGLSLWNEYGFIILLLLIACGGLYEFYSIVFQRKLKITEFIFIGLGLSLVSVKIWLPNYNELSFGFLLTLIFIASVISTLFDKHKSFKDIIWLNTGIVYIALPLYLFSKMPYFSEPFQCFGGTYKPQLALNLFILIWCSDTFAYLCGKAFGKHKLLERISPKKTWEGLIGALILTVLFSTVLAHYFDIPFKINIVLAFCTVIFGTLGDLVESKLKREFNIKDSGNILPGHGGVLDRFDALFISLPVTLLVYQWM